jgi:dTDP-4-dehydrorhamnose reductase
MIVVTGASGLLGTSAVLEARSLGREVVGLYHGHPVQIPGVIMRQVNLIDLAATRELLIELHPDTIIHCAAVTHLDWCETHPEESEKLNVHASSLLAEIAQELDARFLYISTDAVFDGRRGNYSETDEPAPLNVYARTKLAGELAALQQHASALVVRVNIYGWNVQPKLSLAEWFLKQLKEEKEVPGFTDVIFCPTLVNDLSGILLRMLDRGLSGVFHVSGSERISKYEFGRCVAATFGLDPKKMLPSQIAEANLKARRSLDISLNTTKISQTMGVEMPSVEAGLRRFRALYDEGYPAQLKSYLAAVAA